MKTHRIALLLVMSACFGLACESVLGLSGTTVIVGADGSLDGVSADSGGTDVLGVTDSEPAEAGLDAAPDSLTDSGPDAGADAPEAGTCPTKSPIGSSFCKLDEDCCQMGTGIPVGASCLEYQPSKGTTTHECVTRCNSMSDCPSGTCCVENHGSVDKSGPYEPGGWCLSLDLRTDIDGKCLTGYANDTICTGSGTKFVCDAAPD